MNGSYKYDSKKRRVREHIIADLSCNYVERIILECGFTATEFRKDYGYDLQVNTFNQRGGIENGFLLLQLKATDNLQRRRDNSIKFVLKRKDLKTWTKELFPVVLCLYDVKNKKCYYLHIQDYFQKKRINVDKIKTATHAVSIGNRILKVSTFKELKKIKNDFAKKVWKAI